MTVATVAPGLAFQTGQGRVLWQAASCPGGRLLVSEARRQSTSSVCLWGTWARVLLTWCSPVFLAGSWDGGLSTQTPRWWLRVKAEKVKLDPPTPLPTPQAGWSRGGARWAPWKQTGWVPGPARHTDTGAAGAGPRNSPRAFPRHGLGGARRVCHVFLSPLQSLYPTLRGMGQALLSPFYRREH